MNTLCLKRTLTLNRIIGVEGVHIPIDWTVPKDACPFQKPDSCCHSSCHVCQYMFGYEGVRSMEPRRKAHVYVYTKFFLVCLYLLGIINKVFILKITQRCPTRTSRIGKWTSPHHCHRYYSSSPSSLPIYTTSDPATITITSFTNSWCESWWCLGFERSSTQV